METLNIFDKPFFLGGRAAFVSQFRTTWLVKVFSCFLGYHIQASLQQSGELDAYVIGMWIENNGENESLTTLDMTNNILGDRGAMGF